MSGWMFRERFTVRCAAVCGALLLMVMAFAEASPAAAQGQASATVQRTFDIPAQPLREALLVFGQQSGLQVTAQGPLVEGRTSTAVSGSFTPAEALGRLLTGTGLAFRFNGTDAVEIEPAPQVSESAVQLGPVRVAGEGAAGTRAESAWGPVDGYVATRSASATKTDIPLLEVPQTVDVVTADQIQAQNAKSVRNALRYTGGIDAESGGIDEVDERIIIRGWAQFNGNAYLNGLQLGSIDPYFLERVEVIKGPASVTYGNANPGGIVTTVQKMPSEERLFEGFIQGGAPNRVDAGFDLGGPLNDRKTLLYRVTGIGFSRHNQMDKAPATQRWSIAPSIALKPSERTNLTLWGSYQNDPTKLMYPWLRPEMTVFPGPLGPISRSTYIGNPDQNYFKTEEFRVGYTFSHGFASGFRFDSTAGYRDTDTAYLTASGSNFGSLIDDQWFDVGITKSEGKSSAFQADNRFSYAFGTGALEHKTLLGVDYRHGDSQGATWFGPAYPFNIRNPDHSVVLSEPVLPNPNKSNNQQLGLYVQDQVKWQKWSLLLGLRHDWYDEESVSGRTGVVSEFSQRATTYRVGVTHQFGNGLAPYFSNSISFQPANGFDFFGNAFKPTTGQQYEGGVKYEIPGTRSLLQAAAFQITQQNLLTGDTDPEHCCFYSTQIGEVRSRGVEASVKTDITTRWSLMTSYSYVAPVITRSNNGDEGRDAMFSGARHRASLWTSYSLGTSALADLSVGGGIRFTGGFHNRFVDLDMSRIALVDLIAGYDIGRRHPRLHGWRVDLNITNLFDKTYFLGTTTDFYYGEARVISARLAYRF